MDTIEDGLADLRAGRPIILVDDEDRENEGDLVVAAECVNEEVINFMATHGRGLICVPMTGERLDALGIPMMVRSKDGRQHASPFTVSVEAATGVSTGISAGDRARTISVLADSSSTADEIVMPGHVFPLRAHPEGLRGRHGHTEASLELVQRAGFSPVAVICEIMNADGTMARRGDLKEFARRHRLRTLAITDLATTAQGQPDRLHTVAPGVVADDNGGRDEKTAAAFTRFVEMPTAFGTFSAAAFVDSDGCEHVALTYGRPGDISAPLVRIHSECLTGDAFGSVRCDCGDQLAAAMELIAAEGDGAVLYLRQEGRGIGLANKLRAYALQDRGYDTVEANQHLGFAPDERDYGIAVAMLRALGIGSVRLLTNNPAKLSSLASGGIEIVERIPLTKQRNENERYMRTKAEKLQHLIEDYEVRG